MNSNIQRWGEESSIDIRAAIINIAAQRWWVLSSIVIVTSICVGIALLSTPIYRGTVVLVPSEHSQSDSIFGSALGQLGGLASLAGISIGNSSSIVEETLAVLRSRHFTESFIADQHLMPELFARRWDKRSQLWRTRSGEPPSAAQAYKKFDRIRTVTVDKKTGLITLSIEWSDRVKAALWANLLVERLNEEMRRRAIDQAEASLEFLERELPGTVNVASRDALARLIEVQMKQRMLAHVSKQYAVRVVDPALPPDEGDPIRPKRLQLLIIGPFAGLVIGVLMALFVSWWRESFRSELASNH